MPFSAHDFNDYGRGNFGPPIRQGLIYRRPIKQYGRQVKFPKWKYSWCIVTPLGMFFFEHFDIESDKSKCYILFNDTNFKMNDLAQVPGTFQFEIVTSVDQYEFECHNFTEKDEWKKAIQKAKAESAHFPNPYRGHKLTAVNETGPKLPPMKAQVTVVVKEAKDLPTPGNTYCKLVLNHDVVKTKIKSNSNKPSWDESFSFNITQLPVDINLVMFDSPSNNPNGDAATTVVGTLNVKIEIAGERGDQREWYDLRPSELGAKGKGKVSLMITTRYDAETQKRVTFGVRLSDLMARESHKSFIIPDVAYKCIKVLNAQALDMQGIFRVPGNKNKMRDYELKFDTEGVSVDFKKSDDEHVVASIFKMFLRDMPEPVVPYSCFSSIVDATKKDTPEAIIAALKLVIMTKLPEINFRLLKVACCLLYKITLHVEKNLMKPTNLAIVFGPVFCAPPPDDTVTKQIMVAQLPALSVAAEILIKDFLDIFNVRADEDPIQDMIASENKLTESNIKMFTPSLEARSSSPKESAEASLLSTNAVDQSVSEDTCATASANLEAQVEA